MTVVMLLENALRDFELATVSPGEVVDVISEMHMSEGTMGRDVHRRMTII